jgi:mono/diheme cytochrome c family protein
MSGRIFPIASIALLGSVMILAGCARLPVFEPKALAPSELQAVRDQVRGYARTHCGKCHIASLPTSLPAALKIYNLDAPEWSSTLTAGQLRNGFPRRLNRQLDEDGQRQLKAFVEAELALR